MGLWERGFVEFLIEKIKKEGLPSGGYHSDSEIESNVIDMIWDAYEKFNREDQK